MIIQGEVKHIEYKGHKSITVKFSVDELMKNDTPYTNFWIFCLLNDLVIPDPENEGKFKSTIDDVDLDFSDNKENNKVIMAMFEKLDIFVF